MEFLFDFTVDGQQKELSKPFTNDEEALKFGVEIWGEKLLKISKVYTPKEELKLFLEKCGFNTKENFLDFMNIKETSFRSMVRPGAEPPKWYKIAIHVFRIHNPDLYSVKIK